MCPIHKMIPSPSSFRIGESEVFSAKVLLIENHYEELGLNTPWTTSRLLPFCNALRCTPYEIGAMLRIPRGDMSQMLRKSKFSGPVGLHMSMIEDVHLSIKLGRPRRPILPVHLL